MDNLLKFVMDALHNVVYANDEVVVKITASKNFVPEEVKMEEPYSIISIKKII